MPLATAVAAIEELAEVSTIQQVTVSGGEPFLDPAYVFAVAERTRALGLNFRVVTNGTFAFDDATALELLAPLAKLGVETVGVSWDHFHAPFVSTDRVRRVIRTCRQLGMSVRVTVVASRRAGLSEAMTDLGDDGFELPVTQVKCLPVGRAERKVAAEDLLPPAPHEVGRACRRDFDTLSLTPSGDVYPCCAVGGFTEGIRLGRFPDANMAALLARRDREVKWVLLANQGPQALLAKLHREELKELALDGEPVHDCVACHRLFRHPSLAAVAVARYEQQLEARVAPLLARWAEPKASSEMP
jgi:Radical SAM superfamily